ncbi:rhomboid family intramembrane serine protease [Pseudomonas khazarica]|uniref:rhomboid family intramembrane serine protease n=1 Tax=Pseudomonadaceae TaxID=135621 RepID=UPI000568E3F0|nr:rhomboid family intramembrane serine protease [Pseudomonas khazarica]QTS85353.1 rhomboid family intramembrane serine protease [Pseudomonas khazarica]TNF13254.1 MAG: rhomboid family intramembrane serine protease [Pseudomonadales bacterium]
MRRGWLVELRPLLLISGAMLLLQLANSALGGALNVWGLVPRHVEALPGILFAPWLHGSWAHLLSNLSGLLVLGSLVLLRSRRDFLFSSAFIIIGSGLLVWVFGRTGLHIGASGWLFGFWGLLLARAWFERSLLDLLLAVLVFFLYGGWFFGLLPRAGVSFEYHLAGAFCGVCYAALSRRRKGH